LALVASSAAAFNLQPPANEWAKTGTAHELVCKSSEPVTTCSWDTPYEKNYNLKSTGAGLKAESGRLEHFSNGENECGLRINTVEAKDDGVWACNVGVVEGSEVKSAKGQSRLNIAQKPKSVALMDYPGTSGYVNVTDTAEMKVRCVVEAAMPEPSFSWILGEDLLEDARVETVQDEQTWIQTLAYAPSADHHNRTLTCFAGHIGFEEGDETSASALIRVGEGFKDAAAGMNEGGLQSEPKTEKSSGGDGMEAWQYAVILIVVLIAIVVLCVGAQTFIKRKNAGDDEKKAETADPENVEEGGEAKVEETNEEVEGAVQEPKEEEDPSVAGETATASPTTLPCRFRKMLSSLRITRSPVAADECLDTEAAKLTEEGEKDVVKAGRFSIFKMIAKKSDKKAAEEEVVEKEEEDKEKAAMEEEGEKMVELEPEDKPEPPAPVEADEKTKKTDEDAETAEVTDEPEEEKKTEEKAVVAEPVEEPPSTTTATEPTNNPTHTPV